MSFSAFMDEHDSILTHTSLCLCKVFIFQPLLFISFCKCFPSLNGVCVKTGHKNNKIQRTHQHHLERYCLCPKNARLNHVLPAGCGFTTDQQEGYKDHQLFNSKEKHVRARVEGRSQSNIRPTESKHQQQLLTVKTCNQFNFAHFSKSIDLSFL